MFNSFTKKNFNLVQIFYSVSNVTERFSSIFVIGKQRHWYLIPSNLPLDI